MNAHPGWLLIVLGLIVVVGGLAWVFAPGLLGWIGRLPGDIRIETGRTRIYIPIMTCLLLSLLLTIAFWIVGRFTH